MATAVKLCTRCGQTKSISEFHTVHGRPYAPCKACRARYERRRKHALRVGLRAKHAKTVLPDPEIAPRLSDLFWAAGFLEGEGEFLSAQGYYPRLSASQKEPEPLYMLQRLFGGSVRPREKGAWRWYLQGSHRSTEIMQLLYPLLSPRRQAQVRKAVQNYAAICPETAGEL